MCHPIINQIEKTDKAIVAEDFDTLISIYTCDAVLVVEHGKSVVGKQAIRKAFEALAVYFRNGLRVHQNGLEILESGDTALVLENTVVSAPNYPEVTIKQPMSLKRCMVSIGCALSITHMGMSLSKSLTSPHVRTYITTA